MTHYFRALEKVKKKRLEIERIQQKLEEKLETVKDASKWNEILKTPFDVSIFSLFSYLSSSKLTLVMGIIPAGKSNRFHVIHGEPAVGAFWKK